MNRPEPTIVQKVEVPKDLAGERLDKALAALVDGVSRTLARRAIAAGAVRVDGQRVRVASRPVRAGSSLEIGVHRAAMDVEERALHVVAEGKGWIVIDKPAGQHVQGTALGDRGTLARGVEQFLRTRIGANPRSKEGPRAHLVHRLDADASGLLVLATDGRTAAALSEQIASRRMERGYLALIQAIPETVEGVISLPLSGRRKGRVSIDRQGGREALTHYRVRHLYPGCSLACVEARLETGRTHQIRVHFAEKLAPIVGDRLYGRGGPSGRMRLHAWQLAFEDPGTGEAVRFRSDPEDAFYAL